MNLASAFEGIEAATIGHFRSDGFMSPEIQSITEGIRICGPAMTVRAPSDDGTALIHAVSKAVAGQIIVVDRCGDGQHACWGAVMTVAAQSRGVIGAVIDGYVTDRSFIREVNFPLWCRGFSPKTTKIRSGIGSIGETISCGDVEISPNDLILADENGVVVINPTEAAEIARTAQAIQDGEPAIIAKLRNGKTLAEITSPPELSNTAHHMPPL